jgi:hypothetical protein
MEPVYLCPPVARAPGRGAADVQAGYHPMVLVNKPPHVKPVILFN